MATRPRKLDLGSDPPSKSPPGTISPPPPNGPSPIRSVWLRYVQKTNGLLIPVPSDRPLDQFLEFRSSVYEIVIGEPFLVELDNAWLSFQEGNLQRIGVALITEINAFSNAVEVAEHTEPPDRKSTSWAKPLLDKASVVAGSVGDILDNLPPYAKHAITLFKELLDLFKSKG